MGPSIDMMIGISRLHVKPTGVRMRSTVPLMRSTVLPMRSTVLPMHFHRLFFVAARTHVCMGGWAYERLFPVSTLKKLRS